jgi:hypothetical protein
MISSQTCRPTAHNLMPFCSLPSISCATSLWRPSRIFDEFYVTHSSLHLTAILPLLSQEDLKVMEQLGLGSLLYIDHAVTAIPISTNSST